MLGRYLNCAKTMYVSKGTKNTDIEGTVTIQNARRSASSIVVSDSVMMPNETKLTGRAGGAEGPRRTRSG